MFDLLYGGDLSEIGDDTLKGFNVNTFALQVPKAQLRGPNDQVIGVWSTASRKSTRVQTATAARRSRATTSRCHAWACRWSTRSSSRWR